MQGLLSILLIVGVAVLLPGLINRTRAILAGRKGVRFFQHLFSADVQLRKGVVTGNTQTWIFTAAPSVYLATALTVLMFLPFGGLAPLISFNGDVVAVAYLLGLGRLAVILAALDTGSSFEGMGASREALYGAMAEPVLFVVAGTLALISGQTTFAGMFSMMDGFVTGTAIVMLLLFYVILKLITVECGRVPVDDPRTHLELTMIHEVMVLDYSGVDLATINMASWLKMGALAVIGGNIMAAVTGGGCFAVGGFSLLCGVLIGVLESVMARNKLSRNTTYILTIVALAFVLFMVAYMLGLDIQIG